MEVGDKPISDLLSRRPQRNSTISTFSGSSLAFSGSSPGTACDSPEEKSRITVPHLNNILFHDGQFDERCKTPELPFFSNVAPYSSEHETRYGIE